MRLVGSRGIDSSYMKKRKSLLQTEWCLESREAVKSLKKFKKERTRPLGYEQRERTDGAAPKPI